MSRWMAAARMATMVGVCTAALAACAPLSPCEDEECVANRRAAIMAFMGAQQENNAAMQAAFRQPVYRAPVHCTSMLVGAMVSTNCN